VDIQDHRMGEDANRSLRFLMEGIVEKLQLQGFDFTSRPGEVLFNPEALREQASLEVRWEDTVKLLKQLEKDRQALRLKHTQAQAQKGWTAQPKPMAPNPTYTDHGCSCAGCQAARKGRDSNYY
jgi:hypothetical protein